MADHPAILSAHDVRKSFLSGDRQIEVLRGVDLAVSAGESVSICGESGSGKSTLLNLLAGLDKPDAGEIRWAGSPDTGADRRATYLGMVFQSFYLIPELDARANVLMARRICGRPDAEARARADELLARVGLAERRHHLPGQLSGGERQRVAVARALMNRPQLILADEPTGNLDEHTGETVINLLLQLCSETQTTLVLVTHNAAHAARCARSLRLHDGRFV
ncbi:MAG: ABC transporter ATP-binding protein [Opitutaceae bacterium]|jgi:predicted ABC-type transport system involved in lysophospholipase L1 biosynthesis ATPase subunit|nr:ABC transporter ATP-binding protein [Opitutaceae bacterium]HOD47878.1 ABC transporter ATP-binding protein [Opitutaceae bacterium]HOG92008.1 ABC transporter ATP-binding protein [Opitutaceae bacterium]HQL22251.1 ABC transporter ATP-binding protein [Opitutaceae bacterium]